MPSKSQKQKMQDLIESYKRGIEKELGARTYQPNAVSREYMQFKKEAMPRHLTLYEKLCNLSEKILKIKPNKKKEEAIKGDISIAHLNITPSGVVSLSLLAPILIMLCRVFFGSIFCWY